MHALRRKAGYTLVELMIVVAIIGVSVIAIKPGFVRAMADRKASMATRELVRLGRRARAEATGYLRAYMLWIQPGINRVQLLRGATNSCIAQSWPNIQASCNQATVPTCGGAASSCIENVDFNDSVWQSDAFTLAINQEDLTGTLSPANIGICYAPSGLMYTTPTLGGPLSTSNTISGGIVFNLRLLQGGSPVNAARRVLFPLGTTPKVMR